MTEYCNGIHPGREARKGEPWTEDQCWLCWLSLNEPGRVAGRTQASGVIPPPPCPHLWKRVRDASGAVATRAADTVCCGRKALELFECRCPSRRHAGDTNDTVTLQDCQSCPYRPRQVATDARKLTLRCHLSPGDVLVMSAAIYSLHQAHPGKFVTAVDTTANELFQHNPDVVPRTDEFETVQMHYPNINHCNQRGDHFMHAFCAYLEENLRVKVPLLTNRPHLHLAPEEKEWQNQVEQEKGYKGKFWLVNAGRKNDYTTKFWGTDSFQRVVDALRGRVVFVQVGSAEHHHPVLRGAFSLVGRTDLRQLVRLVYHAQGVLCGVTLLHHLAAALEKPCVTIMGGREPVQWNSYPRCHLMHTVGALPCCKDGGCWKSRTVALPDNAEQNGSLCEAPLPGTEPQPRCMALVSAEEVASVILRTAT